MATLEVYIIGMSVSEPPLVDTMSLYVCMGMYVVYVCTLTTHAQM